jgi:hypothetical protein
MGHLSGHRILFPRAFAFAIDDVGWMDGSDLSVTSLKGPHRAGVKRRFDIKDYKAIVDVGREVGVRIQSLFILSELDRGNVLAKYPTTTYLRDQWDNSSRVSEAQRDIIKYVADHASFLEFGMHGTGHEHWPAGKEPRRAEWYNREDKYPWAEDILKQHIQGFKEILAQYGLSAYNGHSFPESFVPCSYSFYWNPEGEYSLGKLLAQEGVKYANTDFSMIPELHPPREVNGGGFDHNVMVINRKNYGNIWYALDCLPDTPVEYQETDIIESHWPNWLAQDDFLQPDVTQKWITYYRNIQKSPQRYLAKNTEQLHSQWLYNKHTRVQEQERGLVEIDNTQMPKGVYQHDLPGNMVLKIRLADGEHISSATTNDDLVPAVFEDSGFAFLYLQPLQREKYTLKYSIGSSLMPLCVYNDGTYNVYDVRQISNQLTIRLRMYGSQVVRIRCPQPGKIVSSSPKLKVCHHSYESGVLSVILESTDIQGSTGVLTLM